MALNQPQQLQLISWKYCCRHCQLAADNSSTHRTPLLCHISHKRDKPAAPPPWTCPKIALVHKRRCCPSYRQRHRCLVSNSSRTHSTPLLRHIPHSETRALHQPARPIPFLRTHKPQLPLRSSAASGPHQQQQQASAQASNCTPPTCSPSAPCHPASPHPLHPCSPHPSPPPHPFC